MQHALKKYFTGIDVQFNINENAQNDFQIGFGQIANLSPIHNLTSYDLSKDKIRNLESFFQKLSKDSIYICRRGQNSGAGHFTSLRFTDGCWWQDNGKKTTQVTNPNGTLIHEFWEREFKVQANVTGPQNHQYSLNLYELSLPALFLSMNFVAMFRQFGEDLDENTIEQFVAIQFNELLEQSDAVFLGLIPQATNYWQISPKIELLPKQINQMKLDYYCHQLIKKNNPAYLDKLLSLPNLDQDQDQILHRLLQDAINSNSFATAKALLKKLAKYVEEEKYLDALQKEKEFCDWIFLKQPFQLRRMQDALDKKNPPIAEMLEEACALNSEEAIKCFFDQSNAHDVLKTQGFAQKLIDTLLKTKCEFEKSGYTMGDAIFIIVKKILENCNADVCDAVIKKLLKAGLQGKEEKKLDEIIQAAFKVHEEHSSSAASQAPECDKKALANATIPPEIGASVLNNILNQYRPNSWTGWILYILSWGTHESKTIQALRQHIQNNPGSNTFTIDELKNAIRNDANTDSKKSHRIRLFEGIEEVDESGTDLVIQNILNQRKS